MSYTLAIKNDNIVAFPTYDAMIQRMDSCLLCVRIALNDSQITN